MLSRERMRVHRHGIAVPVLGRIRVIGMGRSKGGLKVVVIAGFGILVAKHESDGRSREDPFVDAAEPLDCVALLPWRGQVGLAGPLTTNSA